MSGRRTQGQHAGLNRAAILDAAIVIADRDGLAALSMRRLGAALGVEAMALYHHFPNKAALLDGLIERLVDDVQLPDPSAGDWRDGMRHFASSSLEALAAHPNLVPLLLTQSGATAGNHRAMERLLGVLVDADFEPSRALDLVYALNALIVVHGALRAGTSDTGEHGETVQTAILVDLSDDDYPLLVSAARVGAVRGPTARFDAAVDALLDGFGAGRVDG